MKALVFSDSHGNFDRMEKAVSENIGGASLFIFCGDGQANAENIGYEFGIKTVIVGGNCDLYTELPDYKVIELEGHRVFVTHGARLGVKCCIDDAVCEAKKYGCDILLFGHTHVPFLGEKDGVTVMNPGSIGRPRAGKPSYGILTIEGNEVKTETFEVTDD